MAKTLDELKNEDILHSNDVMERIAEIEDALDADYPRDPDLADERAEAEAELATLQAFADEAKGYMSDWDYGDSLIRDSYFLRYAQELAEEIGVLNSISDWPTYHIDWTEAANDLQMDFAAVELDGVVYWAR